MCLALVATQVAFGQRPLIKTKVAFPFKVAGKEFKAGEYSFSTNATAAGGAGYIQIDEGRTTTKIPIITRIAAATHTTPKDAHLVFDRVGDTHYLSEIWVGKEDGYLLATTKGAHEHDVADIP
jgi:hypothetical protein